MITKTYPVEFEIAGTAAAFTNPETGSSPVSYPVPTRSALKSMFECVVMAKNAYFVPQRVEICSPVIYHKYATNYAGPLRKSGTVNYQFFQTVLSDVSYKVYGYVTSYSDKVLANGQNPRHSLQEIFKRRLSQGAFFKTPCLGLSDFTPSYFGEIRQETKACTSVNLTIPSLLDSVFDKQTDGKYAPCFLYNVKVENGVLKFEN